ncbi:MAG: energy transducer TonB [Sphingobacteriales bacterium]|nr:MAG: energy transducer TonB [Sphingobacteriales bacterium]
MSKVSVFDQEWIDLVFEGRNKSYGAYQLRQQDSKTTLLALVTGIALMGAVVCIPMLFNSNDQAIVTTNDDGGIVIHELILPDEPIVLPKENTPPPAETQPEASAPAPSLTPTVRLQTLVATSGPVELEIPNMTDLENANPGPTTSPGNSNGNPLSNAGAGMPEGTDTDGTGTTPGNQTYIAVDEAPAFPGGINEFRKMIGDKFRTPDLEMATVIKIHVSFVVERDGTITNIKVTNKPGHGLDKEALRVLQSIKTKWKPGKIKGQSVRTAYNLPISVKLN